MLLGIITNVLDPIGIVLGILVSIPIVWTWWEVSFGARRRRRIAIEQMKQRPGARPGILIVDLMPGKDVTSTIERYIQTQPVLQGIPSDRRFSITRAKALTPEKMPAVVDDVRACASEIVAAGVDVIHLFYAGPVIPPAIIGAELANLGRVILYQHQQGDYVNWGPLRHPFK